MTTCKWCKVELEYIPLGSSGNTGAIWFGSKSGTGGFYCKMSPAAVRPNGASPEPMNHAVFLPDLRNPDWVRCWLEGRRYRSGFAIAA